MEELHLQGEPLVLMEDTTPTNKMVPDILEDEVLVAVVEAIMVVEDLTDIMRKQEVDLVMLIVHIALLVNQIILYLMVVMP